jgi:hypothetical protein
MFVNILGMHNYMKILVLVQVLVQVVLLVLVLQG